MNDEDIARAQVGAVLLKLPALDWVGAIRIARAEQRLMKNYNPDEPRNQRGRWTDVNGAMPDPAHELYQTGSIRLAAADEDEIDPDPMESTRERLNPDQIGGLDYGPWRRGEIGIDRGKQNRHVPGAQNFDPTRSTLSHPAPEDLLRRFGGTGTPIIPSNAPPSCRVGDPGTKEIIDFGEPIGVARDLSGNSAQTSRGTVHYSKRGGHIVPTFPANSSIDDE